MRTCQKLELLEVWRMRADEARQAYQHAREAFKPAWDDHYSPKLTRDGSFAIQHASKVESEALAEWSRVLRIYSDLILHEIEPPDE